MSPSLLQALRFLPLLLVLPFGLASCSRAGTQADLPAPNVILIVIDTLRADHLGGYGYRRDTTPTLDRFMQHGVRFDAAIAPSSWSPPSHVTILTGAAPDRHGVVKFGQALDPGVAPLSRLLRDQGYATGMFSSHLVLHESVAGLSDGFDHRLVEKNHADAQVLWSAARWVRSTTTPYFLYLCLMTPHAPYDKHPPEYDRLYFTDLPPGGERRFPFSGDKWVGEGSIPQSVRLGDHNDVGYYVNRYDRGLRYMDELIRTFWSELERVGRVDNTLVVVTSDHGEGIGDHGRFAHELDLYDFLVRVPLILHYPERISPGLVWRDPVSLEDIVPTILGLAGLPIPADLDGVDHSAALTGREEFATSRVVGASYLARGHKRYMVRSARYKLIRYADEERESFYDLARDPQETADLMAKRDEGFPEAAYRALRKELEALVARYDAVGANPVVPLPPQVREELRSLGYVDHP